MCEGKQQSRDSRNAGLAWKNEKGLKRGTQSIPGGAEGILRWL